MLLLALIGSLFDIALGYPDWLYARIGHPVGAFAWIIRTAEERFNQSSRSADARKISGAATVALLLAVSLIVGGLLQLLIESLPFGIFLAGLLASSLLAHRSLDVHVATVARELLIGLDRGRAAVSRIVGRDPEMLDEAGVARAAIESLAENFSDGVVAPVFYLAVLGLPGCLAYKAINTADSMIGHLNHRYRNFGWASARLDDVINLPASRLAALWLILAAGLVPGTSAKGAFAATLNDASKHRSPNAGWPEAAMAGALGLTLGGARAYHGHMVEGAELGSGRREAGVIDIHRALTVYRVAAAIQLAVLGAIALGIYSITRLS